MIYLLYFLLGLATFGALAALTIATGRWDGD
jgi:hypothetical protein